MRSNMMLLMAAAIWGLGFVAQRLGMDHMGPFTFTGTGTYIVGQGTVAVIDPGPALERHMDALLATVMMPPGFPVATVALDKAGARNAGLLAAAILATADPALRARLHAFRDAQTAAVRDASLP